MVLDTGSPGGFTLPKGIESRLALSSIPVAGPTIQLVGGIHPSWRAQLDGKVRLADLDYKNPEIVLTTVADGFGNLGYGVLRELRVTVDQASELIRFERAPEREAESSPKQVVRRGGPTTMGGPAGQPRLGVAFEMTPAGFIKKKGGLVVRHVDAGGAADEAGLDVGDILVSVSGRSVAALEGVTEIAALLHSPRPLVLEILRGEERLGITID